MASGHPFQFPTYFPKEFAESQTKKMRKWPYLSPEAPNLKNKGTKFSLTFKFREKKVPLLFRFVVSGLTHGHFLDLALSRCLGLILTQCNAVNTTMLCSLVQCFELQCEEVLLSTGKNGRTLIELSIL